MANVTRTIPANLLAIRRKRWNGMRRDIKHILKTNGELVCKSCGSREHMELHHILPLAMGGTNKLENLMPLCHGCHVKIHRDMSDMIIMEE